MAEEMKRIYEIRRYSKLSGNTQHVAFFEKEEDAQDLVRKREWHAGANLFVVKHWLRTGPCVGTGYSHNLSDEVDTEPYPGKVERNMVNEAEFTLARREVEERAADPVSRTSRGKVPLTPEEAEKYRAAGALTPDEMAAHKRVEESVEGARAGIAAIENRLKPKALLALEGREVPGTCGD